MSHSSTYPCTWCESKAGFENPGQLRTLGRIRELSKAYKEAGSPKTKASAYKNAINEPLFDGDDDTTILEIIPPPELHLMLGMNMVFEQPFYFFFQRLKPENFT